MAAPPYDRANPQAGAAPVNRFAEMVQHYQALHHAGLQRYREQGAHFVIHETEQHIDGLIEETGLVFRPNGDHTITTGFLDLNVMRAGDDLDAPMAAAPQAQAQADAPQNRPAQPQAPAPPQPAAEPKKPAPLKRARRAEAADLGLGESEKLEDFGRGKRRRRGSNDVAVKEEKGVKEE
ncbi:hypothetical protein Rhopal_002612-T1 [Rhodotorula paludigena]|uniref:Uncharacterized protein n=1 Tax=Rhodotorula paludigena TaxID=86838 RepID=A0AAV5GJF5_9BASI|nr:hypothetical protein Rhopal_002612-T1 [Rhodotorula paludigena]